MSEQGRATNFKGGDQFFNQMREAGIGDETFIREIVETFLEESQLTLVDLKNAAKNKQADHLKLSAHKLKAGLLMFDLDEEHKIATELEITRKFDNNVVNQKVDKLVTLSQEKFDLLKEKYL